MSWVLKPRVMKPPRPLSVTEEKFFPTWSASSLKEHQRHGGVIPEIASRRQLEYIQPVVDEALEKAELS